MVGTNPYYATDQQQQQGYPNPPPQQNLGYQPNTAHNINHPPPPPQVIRQRNYNVGVANVAVIYGQAALDVKNCKRCMTETETVVRNKNGSLVWIMCLLLFCVSVCLFWVPFCIDDWKDKEYVCQRCGTLKGYRKGRLCR